MPDKESTNQIDGNGETDNPEIEKKLTISTHGELMRYAFQIQIDNGMSKGAANNYKSGYNGFLKSRGLTDDTPIDGMWEDDAKRETCLETYDQWLKSKGKSETTRQSNLTHVREYKRIYDRVAVKKLPGTFQEALLALIICAGHTIFSFWRLKVIDIIAQNTFYNWCSGRFSPSAKSIVIIKKLEERLGVEKGTL